MTEVTFYILNTVAIIATIALLVGVIKIYKYVKEIHKEVKKDK